MTCLANATAMEHERRRFHGEPLTDFTSRRDLRGFVNLDAELAFGGDDAADRLDREAKVVGTPNGQLAHVDGVAALLALHPSAYQNDLAQRGTRLIGRCDDRRSCHCQFPREIAY